MIFQVKWRPLPLATKKRLTGARKDMGFQCQIFTSDYLQRWACVLTDLAIARESPIVSSRIFAPWHESVPKILEDDIDLGRSLGESIEKETLASNGFLLCELL